MCVYERGVSCWDKAQPRGPGCQLLLQVASAAPLNKGQGSGGWEMWVQGGDEGEKAWPALRVGGRLENQ